MIKLKINFLYAIYTLLLCIFLSGITHADTIGELYTTDGKKFELSQFGSKDKHKEYFLKTENRFVPIEEVKHIIRINTLPGRFSYLIVLANGSFEKGRQGLLFHENVSYTNPATGIRKMAFTPVIKDREQSGLIFTALISANKEQKVIEISYPNNIDRISLDFNLQQHTKNSQNKQSAESLAIN